MMSTEYNLLKGPKKSRIMEIDYIKAFCILAMIMSHCFEATFYSVDETAMGIHSPILWERFIQTCSIVIGASAFMFCMGFCENLSGKVKPIQDIIRGIGILTVGFLLNLTQYLCTFRGMEQMDEFLGGLYSVWIVDILLFAGPAFVLLGLLRKLKLKAWVIFIGSLALCGVGSLFVGFETANPYLNTFLAFFIACGPTFLFPLFHWFAFVAAGNLYREYYIRIEDKKKYYKIALPIFTILTAGYLVMANLQIPPTQILADNELDYLCMSMNPFDTLGSIVCVLTYMGFMWLFAQVISELNLKFHPFEYLSRNLNTIYCIQWVIIFLCDGQGLLPVTQSPIVLTLYAIGILAVDILLCELYKRFLKEKTHRFFGKQPILWVGLVFAVSIACLIISVKFGYTGAFE